MCGTTEDIRYCDYSKIGYCDCILPIPNWSNVMSVELSPCDYYCLGLFFTLAPRESQYTISGALQMEPRFVRTDCLLNLLPEPFPRRRVFLLTHQLADWRRRRVFRRRGRRRRRTRGHLGFLLCLLFSLTLVVNFCKGPINNRLKISGMA